MPPPTPKALRHKARGCADPGATPGPGRSAFPTPQGVVPFMPIGRVDQTQAGSGPVPSSGRRVRPGGLSITQKLSHSTCSTLRHNPPWGCEDPAPPPGVAPRRRNPGLYGRIPLGFPEGWGKVRPWGFPEGKQRWPVLRRFHAHNGSTPAQFISPIRVHSRLPAPYTEGVVPYSPGLRRFRRYPGSRPQRVPYPARGCAVHARWGGR